MSIKLNAQSGGSVALDAPTQTTNSADNVYKLPVADGSAGQVLKTDGSGNLSWVTPASSDYVKLSTASGDLNAYELIFDNLDVTTYRSFDLIGVFQPNDDAESLRLRYRSGGASGSNVSDGGYNFGFSEKKSSNTNNCTADANGPTKIILTGSVGNHSSEGVYINMRVNFGISGDNTSVTHLANSVTWAGTYREQGNAFRGVNGTGQYYTSSVYPTGFQVHFGNGNIRNYSYCLYGIKK